MFARFIALLPLAILTSASHLKARTPCSNGSINCCNSLQTSDEAITLLDTLDLTAVAANIGGLVGLVCNPITVIGTGSSCSAQQQVACCSDDYFNGLVNIGCSNFNIVA